MWVSYRYYSIRPYTHPDIHQGTLHLRGHMVHCFYNGCYRGYYSPAQNIRPCILISNKTAYNLFLLLYHYKNILTIIFLSVCNVRVYMLNYFSVVIRLYSCCSKRLFIPGSVSNLFVTWRVPQTVTELDTDITISSHITLCNRYWSIYLYYSHRLYIPDHIPCHSAQSVCYIENHSDSDHYSCWHSHIQMLRHYTL